MAPSFEKQFEQLYGSNRCSVPAGKGAIEVTFDLGGSIQHIMRLEEDRQVLHAIKSGDDPHWLPTRAEFGKLSAHFKLLQKLSEDSVHPSRQQIARLPRGGNVKMSRVLKMIYGRKVVDLIRGARKR